MSISTGPGPAAACNVKCFGQYRRNFSGIGYLVIPFGYRRGDVDDVGFLESIGAQQMRKYLPVIQTSGVLSIMASARPVTRLVAPGPLVANTTPVLPEVRA